MAVSLMVRNTSTRKRLFRSDALRRLAERICESEGVREEAEISLLFCDDDEIAELNRQYRRKNKPTDVLSFAQNHTPIPGAARLLGDIVISLETVEARFPQSAEKMRAEIRLLFCHGLLHLLGYTHDKPAEEKRMAARQAQLLGVPSEQAWGE